MIWQASCAWQPPCIKGKACGLTLASAHDPEHHCGNLHLECIHGLHVFVVEGDQHEVT